MIALLLFALLRGGGAATVLAYVPGHTPTEISKALKKEVADGERRDEALAIVKAWGKADKQQDKALGKARKTLLKLMTSDGAQRNATMPFTTQIDASIQESDRTFLDMRFQLRGKLTKAEWDAAVARLNR